MNKTIALLLLLLGLAFANPPACPSYPYHDFVWASSYSSPVRPPDTLLDNCASLGLSNPQLCDAMNDTHLTTDEKKRLILDDFVKNNGYPSFAEASAWNGNISFTKYAPDGTQLRSSAYIKDAWVRITSISPSVIDSDSNYTYVNNTGSLRMAKGFTFVVPMETFSGDCQTQYAVCGYDYSLSTYDNDIPLNNQASFTVPQASHLAQNNFSAVLSVNAQYMIHHYHLVTHCYTSNGVTHCYTTCDYSGTDDRHDSLSVSDSKMAYYYGFIAFQNAFIDTYKDNLSDGWLFVVSNEDFNNVKFGIGNSSLTLQSRQYQLSYSLPPYNALTPVSLITPNRMQTKGLSVLSRENRTLSGQEFDNYLRVTEPNLYYFLTQWLGINISALPITFYGDKIHFLAPASSLNCTVEINSHFGRQAFADACRYNETQQPVLNLTIANATNASFVAFARFIDNSTMEPLSGKNLSFSYGNQTRSAITGSSGSALVEFPFIPQTSLVSVVFLTDFETKSAKVYAIVPSKAPDILAFLVQLAGLAFAAWLAYKFLKRWF